jgi:hypothetical protein
MILPPKTILSILFILSKYISIPPGYNKTIRSTCDTPPDLDRRIFEVPDKVLADDVSAVWIFQKSIPKPQRRTLPDALRHMRP